jgi:tRNA-uridine 2-sulfurtransferase
MRVLIAMSGGVDSSVAAAMLRDAGHDVVGATLKLWGGPSDSGCCSVADVEDARWVADRLGIEHHVFNFADDFERLVVDRYAADHAAGRTPNPCIECNRHLKFDRLVRRAGVLGFDAVATGHHARIAVAADGTHRVRRGADLAKDQSYVLHMVTPDVLARCLFPIGDITKAAVRAHALALGLPTADKPDSQEVCFVPSTSGRAPFLRARIPLHPGRVVDTSGQRLGEVEAVELLTVGQRRGLGLAGAEPRYVVSLDVPGRTVTVGSRDELASESVAVPDLRWSATPTRAPLLAQCSAHGPAEPAVVDGTTVRFVVPRRRVAPGQSVVLYDGDTVVAGGTAA